MIELKSSLSVSVSMTGGTYVFSFLLIPNILRVQDNIQNHGIRVAKMTVRKK